MNIKKRDNRIKPFSMERIHNAIKNSYLDVFSGENEFKKDYILLEPMIENEIKELNKDLIDIEEVQDIVVKCLNKLCKEVGKTYTDYRKKRTIEREINGELFKSIEGIINGSNKKALNENGNKKGELNSVQRDLIAGEVSKAIAKKIIPTDIYKSHEEGSIHIHDLDYFIQHEYNCFDKNTKIITSKGTFSFDELSKEEEILVPTHTGEWKKARVKSYGVQDLYRLKFKRQNGMTKEVVCTENHRWILKNGDVTTNISIGDRLIQTPVIESFDIENMSLEEKESWVMGFIIGDGSDYSYNQVQGCQIRLCGDKNKYGHLFKEVGFSETNAVKHSADKMYRKQGLRKQYFLDNKEYLKLNKNQKVSLINGLFCADASVDKNGNFKMLTSVDSRVLEMVRELSEIAGYYLNGEFVVEGTTNYAPNGRKPLTYIQFNKKQYRVNWKLIEKEYLKTETVWCLEVEDNHSFILSNGMVTGNCELVNLKDMLDNGTVINGKLIETPHTLKTAMNVATQISAVVASNTYGGQTMSISHLSPYLRKSINIIRNKYDNMRHLFKDGCEDEIENEINKEIRKEIKDSVQTLSYQINTLSSTNGQTPFQSIALYLNEDKEYIKETALLIEEIFNQRLLGIKNENGVYETPPFPKLLYFLDENNTYEGSEYFWLTELSAKCCAKRLNPDFISVKIMKENTGFAFPCMGCRAFLSPIYKDGVGINDFYGRGNNGVCTLNMPFIALDSIKNSRDFFDTLDEYLEKVKRVGELRWSKLEGVTTSVAPLLWEHGAISRSPKGTKIVDIMKERGFTTTIGFSGLYETVYALIGKSLTTKEGFELGEKILSYLEKTKDKWNDENPTMKWAIYSSPQENTTDKFARSLKQSFGVIEQVSDRDFVTNGFHIHVEEPIDAFSKLEIEGKLQRHVLGGSVSYVEVDNLSKNIPALIKIIQHIYETIQYGEINYENDLCNCCMYEGAMNRNETLDRWECPNCGNVNQDTISVSRRLCGYINSSKEWSKGRLKDILSRVKHL